MIHTYLLNPEDSVKADHIYGPYRPLLQGGTKCCRNTDKKVPIILLPTDISLHHKNIELYFDFLTELLSYIQSHLIPPSSQQKSMLQREHITSSKKSTH